MKNSPIPNTLLKKEDEKMNKLSISFTLGKQSKPNQVNIKHNNREFVAKNVNSDKIKDNVTYIAQDVTEAYEQLFGEALEEYNEKQTRADRKIENYYEHIEKSKREEAFYEAVVQYGDVETAPCGSETGEKCKQMLDIYFKEFKKQNPNLYVFNAVLHMDEASPHLHIDFIPFYTKGRTKSLSKGVSMRAALDEEGFTATNGKINRLVAWEERERQTMEKVLNAYNFVRDDKNTKHRHMDVETYKSYKDDMKILSRFKEKLNATSQEIQANDFKRKIFALENENRNLKEQKHSPYKAFYYSSPEKQAFVQAELDKLGIPYRETDNGFEAQEFFVDSIRKIEKDFKAPNTTAREKLRNDIDRLLMQSNSFDEFILRLQKEKYEVKRGKYIAVKPQYGTNFIRLKSLGEQYSEYALTNRLNAKKKYEHNLNEKINETPKEETSKLIVLKTMQFYTVSFAKGGLPMRKRNKQRPYAWTNDSELDKLTELNERINTGATIDSLKKEFEALEYTVSEKENELAKSKKDLKAFYDLKEKIEIIFENKKSDKFTRAEAEKTLKIYPSITRNNYKNIDTLIDNEIQAQAQIERDLKIENENLKSTSDLLSTAEKVFGGTYVQSLVGDERQRRESDIIPNGFKSVN